MATELIDLRVRSLRNLLLIMILLLIEGLDRFLYVNQVGKILLKSLWDLKKNLKFIMVLKYQLRIV